MNEKPRDPKVSIFANGFAASMIFYGVLVGAGNAHLLYAGRIVLSDPDTADRVACTMSFATLVFCELTRAFAVRSEHHSIFKIGVFSNSMMNKAFAVGLILQLAVLFIPPFQDVFGVMYLSAREWGIIIILSLMPLIVSEIVKGVKRK